MDYGINCRAMETLIVLVILKPLLIAVSTYILCGASRNIGKMAKKNVNIIPDTLGRKCSKDVAAMQYNMDICKNQCPANS